MTLGHIMSQTGGSQAQSLGGHHIIPVVIKYCTLMVLGESKDFHSDCPKQQEVFISLHNSMSLHISQYVANILHTHSDIRVIIYHQGGYVFGHVSLFVGSITQTLLDGFQ